MEGGLRFFPQAGAGSSEEEASAVWEAASFPVGFSVAGQLLQGNDRIISSHLHKLEELLRT